MPGVTHIGIIYDTLPSTAFTSLHLKQCEHCVAMFVAADGSGDRFCNRCKSRQLSDESAQNWSEMKQLEAIAVPYLAREFQHKPKRERTTEPLGVRLVAAFKASADGTLSAQDLTSVAATCSVNRAIVRARLVGVWIVPAGIRKVHAAGAPRRFFALGSEPDTVSHY